MGRTAAGESRRVNERIIMLCCVIGLILVARFVVNYGEIRRFLGYEAKEEKDREGYGYEDR